MRPRLAAEQVPQLVAHNFHHLLVGRKLQQHFRPERFFAHVGNEFVRHAQVHVRIKQRLANLGKRRVQMLLGQLSLSAEVLEGSLQLVCECFKHELVP